jgi:DNA polymerase elongation subunit (family B)
MSGRFEYRVFDKNLNHKKDFLKNSFKQIDQKHTNEEYILSKQIHEYNIKIRDNRLDIKKLHSVVDGFEQWDILFKKKFPIQVESLNTLLKKNIVSKKQFLDESELKVLITSQNNLKLIALSKERIQFEKNTLLAEFTLLEFENKIFHSIALESTNLEELKKYTQILGLEAFENINYYKFLQKNI